MRTFGPALVALAGFGACAPPAEPGLPSRLDAIARAPVESGDVVGLSVAVTRGSAALYCGAHGLADARVGTPMSVSTPLRLASVSKMMTAALALLLESQGILSLDTPLVALVPEAEGWLDPGATLRHGLNHTTGIPDYLDADIERFRRTRGPLTDAFVIAQGARMPSYFEPGTQWAYSNTGFYLAALAMRRATGSSWETLVHERLAVPLALESLQECDRCIEESRLHGYETGGGPPVDAVLYQATGIRGDGGLCATAADVAAFARKLERGKDLGPGVFERMVTPTVLAGGTGIDYGLGVRLGSLGGHRMWGHTGSVVDAYVATVMRFPDDDVTVVVLLNTVDASLDGSRAATHSWETTSAGARGPSGAAWWRPPVESSWNAGAHPPLSSR